MIIELLLSLIYNLFNLLTSPIHIPGYDSIYDQFEPLIHIALQTIPLLNNFVDLSVASALLIILVFIDVGVALYHFVMWILRKIPMIGVS